MMPMAYRKRLSQRFFQNWSAAHPEGLASPDEVVDDSLTSLAWLQNLNIMKLGAGRSNSVTNSSTTAGMVGGASNPHHQSSLNRTLSLPNGVLTNRQLQQKHYLQQQQQQLQQQQQQQLLLQKQQEQQHQKQQQYQYSRMQVDPNIILDMTNHHHHPQRIQPPIAIVPPTRIPSYTQTTVSLGDEHSSYDCDVISRSDECDVTAADLGGMMEVNEEVNYKTNPSIKPHHSYARLICMAMHEVPQMRLTLSTLYSWIVENFPYYATADPSWQVCTYISYIDDVIFNDTCLYRVAYMSLLCIVRAYIIYYIPYMFLSYLRHVSILYHTIHVPIVLISYMHNCTCLFHLQYHIYSMSLF